MQHYVYVHTRNDTHEVFYVGKGQRVRAYDHNQRNRHWKAVARKVGFTAHILKRFDGEQEALDHEVASIRFFRSIGSPLVNYTNGGEGWSGMKHTPEYKEYMRQVIKARPVTEETRKKMSASAKKRAAEGRNANCTSELNPMRRPEVREKNSRSQPRTPHSLERRMKTSASQKGKPKFKLRGRKPTDETRAKMSLASKGRPKSPEHVAAIAAAHQARAARMREMKEMTL